LNKMDPVTKLTGTTLFAKLNRFLNTMHAEDEKKKNSTGQAFPPETELERLAAQLYEERAAQQERAEEAKQLTARRREMQEGLLLAGDCNREAALNVAARIGGGSSAAGGAKSPAFRPPARPIAAGASIAPGLSSPPAATSASRKRSNEEQLVTPSPPTPDTRPAAKRRQLADTAAELLGAIKGVVEALPAQGAEKERAAATAAEREDRKDHQNAVLNEFRESRIRELEHERQLRDEELQRQEHAEATRQRERREDLEHDRERRAADAKNLSVCAF
jgi:hypothetical protein